MPADLRRRPVDYAQLADDESKKGGDMERAKVLAQLAVAQAIEDLGYEVAHMATQAHPIYHRDADA